MLLSEVAKTGRKFWRKGQVEQFYLLEGKKIVRKRMNFSSDEDHRNVDGSPKMENWVPDAEELVATDWEVEAKSVTVTAKELREWGTRSTIAEKHVRELIEFLGLNDG